MSMDVGHAYNTSIPGAGRETDLQFAVGFNP